MHSFSFKTCSSTAATNNQLPCMSCFLWLLNEDPECSRHRDRRRGLQAARETIRVQRVTIRQHNWSVSSLFFDRAHIHNQPSNCGKDFRRCWAWLSSVNWLLFIRLHCDRCLHRTTLACMLHQLEELWFHLAWSEAAFSFSRVEVRQLVLVRWSSWNQPHMAHQRSNQLHKAESVRSHQLRSLCL